MTTRSRVFELGRGPWTTFDPFLFCVHHLDRYPAGTDKMAPAPALLKGRDIGSDFSYKDGWSMYHGDTIPGFPSHPHRGFETITVTLQGHVDHSDSMGATARYGQGDTQWMTAGAGIQHSEMFPLLNRTGPNTMEMFQIWLNLPAASKMVKPHFAMFWNEDTPLLRIPAKSGQETTVKVIAGKFGDAVALPPPPESWASNPDSDIAVFIISLPAGASLEVPASRTAQATRTVYYYQGTAPLTVDADPLNPRQGIKVLDPTRPTVLTASDAATERTNVLVMQGRSIGEPVAQHGPFVMNSQAEIRQAFADYHKTQFGGWPWPTSDHAHPSSQGRFALHPDGHKDQPPATK